MLSDPNPPAPPATGAQAPSHRVLTINGGSSSIKFALFEINASLQRVLAGQIERIGLPNPVFTVKTFRPGRSDPASKDSEDFSRPLNVSDHSAAVRELLDWLAGHFDGRGPTAIGHRVVHGGPKNDQPCQINLELIEELSQLTSFDPAHLPGEIRLIREFHSRFPDVPQVACFATAFHREMPRVAKLLPIPRRFDAQGVRRYGFHGLSYAFLMEELARLSDRAATQGRVILAHLGNGASLAAVRDGQSLDTSMGFTPTAGVPMSTRSGDLDPGLVLYLARMEHLDATQFNEMVNSQSGLLGVSETSSDMRDLIAREPTDVRAAEAVALFCYQIKKTIGAYAAVLGGLDTLVFAGGIGENSPKVRARICNGLAFLGIEIDAGQNAANAGIISANRARITVRVIRTDEESMIARTVCRVLNLAATK